MPPRTCRLTANTIGLGDMLMSNPALPGSVGFCGALVVGAVLSLVGQPIQTGYWLAAGAWGMLAFTDYVFEKYDVEHLKFERDASIALGSVAAVELEEDEDSGPTPPTPQSRSSCPAAMGSPLIRPSWPWPHFVRLGLCG